MSSKTRAAARKTKKKASKSFKKNRTLSLREPYFSQFQALCKKEGATVSERLDELIQAYLNL